MLHNILPFADPNRGFDAFPNHAASYGWTGEYNPMVWVFPKTDGDGNVRNFDMTGSFIYPSVVAANQNIRLILEVGVNAVAADGQMRFAFQYKMIRGDDVASLDLNLETGFDDQHGLVRVAGVAARNRLLINQRLTQSLIAKGDRVYWRLRRTANNVNDTLAVPVLLFGMYVDDGL